MPSNKEPRVKLILGNDGIAEVILNRPDKLNALDMDMFHTINQTIKTIKKNKHVKVVILRGEGEDFCSGLDVKSVLKNPMSALKLLAKWLPGNANLAQKVTANWRNLSVPVIAAIHGRCWGGGMQIALGADFRIATPNASLSIMEAKWGLIPDMAGNSALTRQMPMDQAMKLTMTAAKFDGTQGKEYQLITDVAEEPVKAAKRLASELIETSPDVLAATKKLFYKNWHKSERSMRGNESWYQVKILAGKNQKIAAQRASGKDKDFKPRSFT